MPVNLITGLLYGPQGPETRRYKDNTWGKYLEDVVAGKDDENFIEKTGILCKYTFGFGSFFAMLDVVLYNNKGGLPGALERMKYHFTPWIGCAIAYTATVNVCSGLRGGKSDHKNHIAGGFAAGTVIGKHVRCFRTGAISGGILAVLGYIYKDSRLNGYDVIPEFWLKPGFHGNPFSHKLDLTTSWIKERPGYWARTEEDVPRVYKQGQLADGNQTRLW